MNAKRNLSPLDQLKIGSPCPADWNDMEGDDRMRYCGLCRLNVYNISAMSREDAEHLLKTHEGRLCVRYIQRPDGKIMTKHCPKGEVAAWRRKLLVASLSAMAFVFAGVAAAFTPRDKRESWYETTKANARTYEPLRQLIDKIDPPKYYLLGQRIWTFPAGSNHTTKP